MRYLDVGHTTPMKYILPSQFDTSVRPDKPIEQFITTYEVNGYKAIRWISIDQEKDKFQLSLHEVFDDSAEGIDSIYNFSYVEPDDIHGKLVFESTIFSDVLEHANQQYGANNERYLNFGLLDELLNSKE